MYPSWETVENARTFLMSDWAAAASAAAKAVATPKLAMMVIVTGVSARMGLMRTIR